MEYELCGTGKEEKIEKRVKGGNCLFLGGNRSKDTFDCDVDYEYLVIIARALP